LAAAETQSLDSVFAAEEEEDSMEEATARGERAAMAAAAAVEVVAESLVGMAASEEGAAEATDKGKAEARA
jgi:hypothetical protein